MVTQTSSHPRVSAGLLAIALLVFALAFLSTTASSQTVTTYSTLTTVTVPLTTSTTTFTFTVSATTGTTTASYTFNATTYSTYSYTQYTGTTYTVITTFLTAPATTYTITSTFTSSALTGEATYTYTFGGNTITTWVYGVSTISGGSSTSGSSSSSSSTTQGSSTTNETSGSSSTPNSDLLPIAAGLGLLVLLVGGYLLWRRRKGPTEGPPPPPPPPPPTTGTTPPPSTPPPVVPVPPLVTQKPPCPDGWVPKEDQACWGYVTLVVFAKPTVVVEGAYQASEKDIEEAIKGVETFLNVASWAGLVQGAAGGLTELVSSVIEGRTVDPAAEAAMDGIRKLVEARRKLNQAGYAKVIFPREFFHYQCIVVRECVDGDWVVKDKKFVFERVKRGTPPEVVIDIPVLATDLAQESYLLGKTRNWAYQQNVAAYKKINECRKTCEQIADYSTWQPPEGSK